MFWGVEDGRGGVEGTDGDVEGRVTVGWTEEGMISMRC